MNLRLPKITGNTPEEQIRQLTSYLYQLVQELNYQLEQLERGDKE